MRVPQSLAVLALIGAFATGPARAGPSDIVTLHETPFGYAPGVLFLIRATWDNVGSHEGSRDDLFFVTRDLASGTETVEPLRAITRIVDYDADATGHTWDIVDQTPDGAPAPFARLTASGALPWASVVIPPAWIAPTATFDDTALTVVFHDETRSLPTPAVFAAMDRIVAATADAMPGYNRISTLTGAEALRGRRFDAADCAVKEVLRAVFLRSDPHLVLARISCEVEETDQTSFLVILPLP